jgi:hypothetical protein
VHDARRLYQKQPPASVFSEPEAIASFVSVTLAGFYQEL